MPSRRISSIYLQRARNTSIRQQHETGPMFHKRRHFNFSNKFRRLHQRESASIHNSKDPTDESKWHVHMPGDVQRRPDHDYSFNPRVDKIRYAWEPRGRLQVHQLTGKAETFACYNCGYPTKSHLVVIKDDNWDWRMCYRCYCKVVSEGMEDHT